MSRVLSFSRRLARAATCLFPRDFRHEFGGEIEAFVEAWAADERFAGGPFPRTRLALRVLRDVLPAAAATRVRAHTRRKVPPSIVARREDRMDTLLQDLRYAVRTLVRRPGFAIVAVVTLMLGIGANTAIFSVVNAVLLRPLPYPHANRLAVLWGRSASHPRLLVTVPDFLEWRARNRAFEDLGIERSQSVNLTGVDKPDRLIGDFVDSHTLRILGARASLGRLFTDSETTIGTGRDVAVLSNAVWKSRFGSDPNILGKSLTLNGRPFQVIGVLAPDFKDPYTGTQVYLPITSPPDANWLTRENPNVWAIGRLRRGVTADAAQRDIDAIEAELVRTYPASNGPPGAAVQPLQASLVGPIRPFLLVAFGAVVFVLLIACANVANLMLSRAVARRREMSLRAALGARGSRLVRQLLTESLMLAMAGGAAGILVARWGVTLLTAAYPGAVPAYGPVGIDGRVLMFSLAITVAAGLVFGAAPAAFATRVNLNDALTARGSDGAPGGRADLRSGFVGVQLALCVILLVGSALLVRSLQKLAATDPGFDPDHVLTAEFRLPSGKYRTPDAITQFMARALAEIRAIPGVRSAALVRAVPLSGNWGSVSYVPDNRLGLDPKNAPTAQENDVSNGFFATMKTPLLSGREFDAEDRAGTPPVAIVNRTFAEQAWPNESPLGHRVHLLGTPDSWVTIVGEVADMRQLTLGEPPTAQLYQPIAQQPGIFSSVVVRTTGDPDALANQLRAAIWRVDADQPVWAVEPLASLVTDEIAPPRFTMLLSVAFAALALLLATIGVYGVMSYAVTQRTREVGIRMALGADRAHVVRLIVGTGLRVIAVALVVGIAGAAALARLMASQLVDVSAADPLAFTVAPAVLAAAAIAACYLPARRAARVDPATTLRSD